MFTICENKSNTQHYLLTFIKVLSLAMNTTLTNNWEQWPESETLCPKLTRGNYGDLTAPAVFSLNNVASARLTRQDSHFMSLWKQSVYLLSVIETFQHLLAERCIQLTLGSSPVSTLSQWSDTELRLSRGESTAICWNFQSNDWMIRLRMMLCQLSWPWRERWCYYSWWRHDRQRSLGSWVYPLRKTRNINT